MVLSLTKLTRYASRVAADVETVLGSEKTRNGGCKQVQARINNVNR